MIYKWLIYFLAKKRVSKGDKSVLIVSVIMNMQHYRAIITWLQVTGSWTCGCTGLRLMNYLMLLTLAIQNLFRLSVPVLPMSFITDLHHLLRVAKFALIVLAVCKTRFISVCKYRYHWLHPESDTYFCWTHSDGSCLCDMYYDKSPTHSYE